MIRNESSGISFHEGDIYSYAGMLYRNGKFKIKKLIIKKLEKEDMWKYPMNWLLLNTEHIWDQGLTTYRESSVDQWTKEKKSKH